MRYVAHGIVYFKDKDKTKILQMMRDYSSALRCAYQGIHKHQLRGNNLKKYVKVNYSQYLNATWVADACMQAGMINQEHSVFGGKASWKKLQGGIITKEQWQMRRNNQLYARGEKSRQGNRQIRFSRDLATVYVNSPEGRNKWIEGKCYLPEKFKKRLDLSCYAVRLIYIHSKDTIELRVEFDADEPKAVIIDASEGVVGIDTNPDLLAVVETDACGNLKTHRNIKAQRISYAKASKRDSDVYELAKQVVDRAILLGKPIVLEELKFTAEGKEKCNRKFKRIKSNFVYSKLLAAIESRAIRSGVAVIKVNPAFTSQLGLLKYASMYSLSRHSAAALCVARRGQGIDKERATYNVSIKPKKVQGKEVTCWNLEGRQHVSGLSEKAYSWLGGCFVRESRQYIDNRTSQVTL